MFFRKDPPQTEGRRDADPGIKTPPDNIDNKTQKPARGVRVGAGAACHGPARPGVRENQKEERCSEFARRSRSRIIIRTAPRGSG